MGTIWLMWMLNTSANWGSGNSAVVSGSRWNRKNGSFSLEDAEFGSDNKALGTEEELDMDSG